MSSTLPGRFLVPNGRTGEGPARDCPHCPRLVAFRAKNREVFPDFHNSPVASFGGTDARLLVVGLAPGLKGANRTGRPCTGDYAGDLLYRTLLKFGFAEGDYRADPNDGLRLVGARITNAVRCVPPENKPTPNEVATCRPFLEHEIASLERLAAVLCLGNISHASILACFGLRPSAHKFAHGAEHVLPNGLHLFDSYHCSRLNTNTGRLTAAMFEAVLARIKAHIGA
jgi:uracil-DNA glycosylase family 4